MRTTSREQELLRLIIEGVVHHSDLSKLLPKDMSAWDRTFILYQMATGLNSIVITPRDVQVYNDILRHSKEDIDLL